MADIRCLKCNSIVNRCHPYPKDIKGRLVGVEVCKCGHSFGLVLTPEERGKIQNGWKPCAEIKKKVDTETGHDFGSPTTCGKRRRY